VRGLVAIASGRKGNLTMHGDLNAVRDFSFAGDVADGMWRMLQQESPRDLILASGVGTTIMEFAVAVGNALALPSGVVKKAVHSYFAGTPATPLVGDPSLAAEVLGWKTSTDVPSLARILIGGVRL
jgi:GDPmannose 4,6-dehydratase